MNTQKNPNKLKYRKKRKWIFWLIDSVLVVLIIWISFLMIQAFSNHQFQSSGIAYLNAQNQVDTEPLVQSIDEKIQLHQQKENEQEKQELLSSLDDPDALYASFNSSMIVGDSRAVGFLSYTPLDSSIVLAEVGASVLNCSNYFDQIQAKKPEYLFMMYGTNDTGGEDMAANADRFRQIIEGIHEISPDTKIFVLSVLPSTETGLINYPSLLNTDAFNEALKDVCEKCDAYYIDGSVFDLPDHQEYYEPDGMHFTASFYEPLARTLMSTALEDS